MHNCMLSNQFNQNVQGTKFARSAYLERFASRVALLKRSTQSDNETGRERYKHFKLLEDH